VGPGSLYVYLVVSIDLAKNVTVIFGYQFSREEPEQIDGYKGKSHPVKACIDGYACDSAYYRQHSAQEKFTEEIGKEQQDKQSAERAYKE